MDKDKEMVCERCGDIIRRNSHRQQYCPKCAYKIKKERERADYYKHMETRPKGTKCKSEQTISDICRTASAKGMSYGEFMAKYR